MNLALRRLWIQLTADRRRFGALCAVVAVGLLLWARLIVVSNMPRMALATEGASAQADKQGTKASRKSGPALGQAANKTPVRISLDAVASRDPFVINPRYFPKPTAPIDTSDEGGKSDVKPAEEAGQAAARLDARLRAGAARLKLEAAIEGSMAIINGRTYREGDMVQGGDEFSFRLDQVRQRSVILVCEDRQFELEMSSPGI